MKSSTFRFLFVALLVVNVYYISPAYAKDNCSDCHHIDFQMPKVNRAVVCNYCHTFFPHGGATYQAPDGSWFQSEATANSTDPVFIHSKHNADNPKMFCEYCHNEVKCSVCHTTEDHTSHGSTTYPAPTYDYATGTTWYKTTNPPATRPQPTTCAISQCHKWYTTGLVYPSQISTPLCLNCHTDPHGEPMGAGDETGIQVNPNGANPATHSDISVKWMFEAGDTLKKSLDGITWSNINIGAPPPGNYFTYTDVGFQNWTIVYYKITKIDSTFRYFPVYPPGTNAHMNYLDNTQMCASCHITHSAEQARLLKETSTEDLCRTCHGLANTGSRYNVDTGEIVVAGTIDANGLITATAYVRSNSGAFGIESGGNYFAGNNPGTWNGAKVTSSHSINSLASYIAPGGGDNTIKLTCTSCHSSHPKKNSFRLLNIGSVEAYAVNPSATDERINYFKNMNTGCGCHRQYINPQNSGHVASGVYFRHSSGVAIQGPYASNNPITGSRWALSTSLPTEYMVYYNNQFETAGNLTGVSPTQYVKDGAVFCITCHYAHGTTATGNSPSAYDLNNDAVLNDFSTMLKRDSNYGVCQNCHQR